MGRLTEKDSNGNWCLKGIPWRELYEGQVITRKVFEKLYGALHKLLDYEEVGLSPEEVERLKERETPKKLLERHYEDPGEPPYIKYACPNGCRIQPMRDSNYCRICGQKLDWGDLRRE